MIFMKYSMTRGERKSQQTSTAELVDFINNFKKRIMPLFEEFFLFADNAR